MGGVLKLQAGDIVRYNNVQYVGVIVIADPLKKGLLIGVDWFPEPPSKKLLWNAEYELDRYCPKEKLYEIV